MVNSLSKMAQSFDSTVFLCLAPNYVNLNTVAVRQPTQSAGPAGPSNWPEPNLDQAFCLQFLVADLY